MLTSKNTQDFQDDSVKRKFGTHDCFQEKSKQRTSKVFTEERWEENRERVRKYWIEVKAERRKQLKLRGPQLIEKKPKLYEELEILKNRKKNINTLRNIKAELSDEDSVRYSKTWKCYYALIGVGVASGVRP